MEDRSLSEKRYNLKEIVKKKNLLPINFFIYGEAEVKEAVKDENELIRLLLDKQITMQEFLTKRDKIFGDKLTK